MLNSDSWLRWCCTRWHRYVGRVAGRGHFWAGAAQPLLLSSVTRRGMFHPCFLPNLSFLAFQDVAWTIWLVYLCNIMLGQTFPCPDVITCNPFTSIHRIAVGCEMHNVTIPGPPGFTRCPRAKRHNYPFLHTLFHIHAKFRMRHLVNVNGINV